MIILFFGVGLLSVISGIFITKNIVHHLAFLHWLRRVEYILLLFVTYYSFKDIKQLKYFCISVWISTLGIIIYGLGQKFYAWPVISTMNKEFSKGMILRLTWWARVNSTFAGHYDLAAYLVMIICLSISLLMIIKDFRKKFFVLLLGCLCYYLLLLTASRISFGAYLVGCLFILIAAKKRWWILSFLVLSIAGMFLSEDLGQRYAATFKVDLSFLSGKMKVKTEEIALAPTLTPSPTAAPIVTYVPRTGKPGPTLTLTPTPTPELEATPLAYFEPTALAVGRSTDIRLKVEWPRAIRAFLKNPLLGTGYSSITLATDNDYLRMLGEIGILGFLAFFAIILEIGKEFYFFLKEKKTTNEEKLIILGIAGAALGYFANATFIDVFEASKIAFFFWIMMGVGLKIIDINRQNLKS